MKKIEFSVHPTLKDKPSNWAAAYGKNWRRQKGTLHDLKDHVSHGGAFIASAMISGHRNSAAFDHSDLAVVDIDNGLTLEDFFKHPLSKSAAWVYTSASHRPEQGKDRFRIVFQLPERVSDGELYKSITGLLIRSLGGDANCSDLCRVFYGNSRSSHPLWQPKAELTPEIISDAQKASDLHKSTYNSQSADVDEHSINLAAYCLEHVLDPTSDGERDRFCNITRAASTGGSALFSYWSDWASRGHHGKGKNSSQTSERFFRGWRGRSLATIFWAADTQSPDWRKSLPSELKTQTGDFKLGVHGNAFGGYDHEDFFGESETTRWDDETEEKIQGLFDSDKPWSQVAVLTKPDQETESRETILPEVAAPFDHDEPEEPTPPRRRGGGNDEDLVERIKDLLNAHYNGLRLNCMSQQLVYGPQNNPQEIHDVSQSYVYISRGQGQIFPKTLVFDLAGVIGYENRYHPVKSYLEHCAATSDICPYFDKIATEILGVPRDSIQNPIMPCGNHLADVVMKRFLIGAVARVLNPGCRHDWMPILIGSQNCGKTTFFQYLTPPAVNDPGNYPWVVTMQQGIEYLKEKPHALHAGWFVVMDEFERYCKRKYSEELKNLVSVSVDRSARKYENEKSYPRAFVLGAATNNSDFLCDPTGNRRFMPIIVEGKVPSKDNPAVKIIDLDRLKKDRNSIWAAAYKAYLDNPVHVFSSYELSFISDYQDSFTRDTPIDSVVTRALETNSSGYHGDKSYVVLADLFGWIDVNVSQQGQMNTPVTDCLKRLGYKPKRIKRNNKSQRVWIKDS
ncbi:MAG: hypothetical protein CMB76_06910 [Euryarchaeota archaeon]|nr:hypothetical protein [Euryarchaeota archaeon]